MSKIVLTVLGIILALLLCSLLYMFADYLGNHVFRFVESLESLRDNVVRKKNKT